MNSCVNHPELESIERCEVCNDSLCSLCLWYGEKGHRYCETHAQAAKLQGEQVYSPQTYAEGIPASLSLSEPSSQASAGAATASGQRIYQGNQQDMFAFVAAAVAIVSMASCMGGIYCLPFIGAIVGGIAYFNADKSLDPKRTRIMGGIAMGVGGLLVVIIVLVMMLYGAVIFSAIASGTSP